MATKSRHLGLERTMADYVPDAERTRVDGFVKLIPEDFHVHEIDTEGNVLTLGRFAPIAEVRRALDRKRRADSGQTFFAGYAEPLSLAYPEDLFTDRDRGRLEGLLAKLAEILRSKTPGPKTLPFALLACSRPEKETRTRAHVWIREHLPFLESKTCDLKSLREGEGADYVSGQPDFGALTDSHSLLHVAPSKACADFLAGATAPELAACPPDETGRSLEELVRSVDTTDYATFNARSYKRYLHFNALKVNRDTSDVVNMLCKTLKRASFDMFSAGNKDKRAVTVQRLCVRRCKIEDVLEAMTRGWFSDVILSDFCYKNERLRLGDLRGNHFKVAIRGVEDVASVERGAEALRRHGFINYFGLQRFGSMLVGTHVVGAALVAQRHELALRLILGDVEGAKQFGVFERYLARLDPARLAQAEPARDVAEDGTARFRRATDHYLVDGDAEAALRHLPGHLFVEKNLLRGLAAGLSFDKCLEKVPKNILSIYVHSAQSLLFNLAATERLNRFGPRVAAGDLVVTGELEEDEEPGKRMHAVEVDSEEEAKRYTIEQVVLPLPGDNVQYPRNMRDYYERVAEDNFGIPLAHFATFREREGAKSKCLVSVSGSYRFVVVRPSDVTVTRVDRLDDPLEVLIRPPEAACGGDEAHAAARHAEARSRLAEAVRNKAAVVLTCSLPKASYVTVALREILRDEAIEHNHG